MKRNKTKKTPRGRTTKFVTKKLKDNTVLLPRGARYKVGESIRYSGKGITPIKRKGKVGKVGYSIDDVPDLKDWKPEVGQGTPEVGEVGQIGFGVGEYSGWKTYTYLPVGDYREEPEPPSAWASWYKLLAGYARELWDALRWFFALPLRALPDVAAPTPAPAPADVPPPEPLAIAPIKDEPGSPFAPHPVKLKTKPFPPIGSPARPKRKPRRRKD